MRAELIAIYAVLHHASTSSAKCTIATDSKAAMHAIHKQIHNPRGNQYNTHRELLRAIASALLHRARTGLRTDIIKVKSHVGTEGNEVADKLANAARNPSACDVSYDNGNLAHQGEHWPMLIAHPQEDIRQSEDRMASNLQATLKDHIACRHSKGLTNHGLYLDAWSKIQADVHKTSHTYWTAPHKVIKNIIRARFGGLYSQKLACRYGHSHDDLCPLCSMPDSAGHILGECTQKDMKSIVIERHNEAGRILAEEIQMGALGNCLMIGDVGKAEKCKALTLHGSKIPDSLLSDSDLTRVGTHRQVVRPDLMMVSITTRHAHALEQRKKRTRNGGMAKMLHTEQGACNITVTIIEVVYCMETRYYDKHKAKMEQHKKLHDALRNAGYQCVIIPIVLGTTGGVFDSNLSGMRQIGISHDRSLTLIRKLSKHAIDYMQSIMDLRRRLERERPP